MLPWNHTFAGRVDELVIDSALLRDNPLGDPHERPLWVYVPPGYDDSDRALPSVYVLQGYTGASADVAQPHAVPPAVPGDRRPADRRRRDPAVHHRLRRRVDGATAARSSSTRPAPAATTRYLCDEVVPFVDARYRTLAAAEHRGVAGKSSGGFGALITPMLRPDLFGGLASHAGDALYEYCYIPEFANDRARRCATSTTARTSGSGRTSARARR